MSNFKPFNEMVRNLFKIDGFNEDAAGLMHAAIGISGEVVELLWSSTKENFIEEAGDVEFYVCAALQEMRFTSEQYNRVIVAVNVYLEQQLTPEKTSTDLMKNAGGFIDLAKKSWVYSKPREEIVDEVSQYLGSILGSLIFLYNIHGISRQEVIDSNQTKLGIRYPDGVYSNEHANERKDKV